MLADNAEMVRLIRSRLAEADDALGKELRARLTDESQAADAMIGMASQHITQAISLLEVVGGPVLALAIMTQRAADIGAHPLAAELN